MVARAVHETGRSPPRGACVRPIRLALVDDVHAGVGETRLVTRLSGDGRITWRTRTAALRSPAGRGTGRAGVRGAGVARVVVVSVVVARPVVRHTRPTPRAADCRPAASGTPVSRSAACACAPCGDPQTSSHTSGHVPLGWFIWMVTSIGMVPSMAWSHSMGWWRPAPSIGMVLPLGWWPRSGDGISSMWRLVRASLSRRGSACRAATVPCGTRPPGRPRPASVLTGPARRASGRRTGAARVSLGGGSGLLRPAAGAAGGAPRPPRDQPLTTAAVTAASIVPYNCPYSA